jgi:hypothetical protein
MIIVLDRVVNKHPELKPQEVLSAWESRIKTQFRLDDEVEYMVAVGVSQNGKLIEMIAFDDADDIVIFHALKATKKMLTELGML